MPSGLLLSVPTLFGLESLAAREVRELGYDTESVEDGRVSFWGDAAAICRANLWLRVAERVQIKAGGFEVLTFDDLFENVKALPWASLLPPDAAFPVKGRIVQSKLASVPSCQAIIKRAIVESMKAGYGGGASIERFPEDGALYSIQFNIIRDKASVYIDTTGDGLHKRGYRADSGLAPIKETLAAALVKLSGWRPGFGLWDPFCGSGTIAIEAALMAVNRAPGINRGFAAEAWDNGKEAGAGAGAGGMRGLAGAGGMRGLAGAGGMRGLAGAGAGAGAGGMRGLAGAGAAGGMRGLAGAGGMPSCGSLAVRGLPGAKDWAAARAEAVSAERATEAPPMLLGSDIERHAVEIARRNATRAGVAHMARFSQLEAADVRPDHGIVRGMGAQLPDRGCVVCNPPYGERFSDAREAEIAVSELAHAIRAFPGWNALAISALNGFERIMGRKADRRRKLYNGTIQCQSYIYYGSRKPPRAAARPAE